MKTILIVEDDSDIQDVFKLIFTSFGYGVVSMGTGTEAVNIRGQLPDAIVLDKQLPGMSGVDVCKHLKAQEQTREIPILMISATSGVEEAAKIAGADDFLEKPFSMDVILKKISKLLNADSEVISD